MIARKHKSLVFNWEELSKFCPYYLQLDISGNIISTGYRLNSYPINPSTHFSTYFEIKVIDTNNFQFKHSIPFGAKCILVNKLDHSEEIVGTFYYVRSCNCIFFSGCRSSERNVQNTHLQLSLIKKQYRYLYKLVKEIFITLFETTAQIIAFLKIDASDNIKFLNNTFALTVSDQKGEVIWCNTNFESLTKFSNDEILGKRPRDSMYGKKSIRIDPNYVDEKIKEGAPFYFENIGYTKYGNEYWFGVTIFPIYNNSNKLIGRLHVVKNITDKKNIQSALLKNETLINLAIENADTIFWTYDRLSDQINLSLKASIHRKTEWKSALKEIIVDVLSHAEITTNAPKLFVNNIELFSDSEKKYFDIMVKAIEWDSKNRPILFVGALHDVTTQNKQFRQLQESNNQLLKLNSDLEKFLYSASHNLRSPLLSVKALLGLIKNGDLSSSEIKTYIDSGISALDNLDNTIIDIVEYSKNSAGNLAITEVDLKRLITECIDEVRFIVSSNFNFLIIDNSNDLKLLSDRSRLKSVFQNLISNAVKYLDEEKEKQYLHITINSNESVFEILFEDNGIGIAKSMQPKIFDLYFRATNKSIGTGLGLSIVREIVNKLKGSVDFRSEYKVGTTFIITVPTGG